MRFRRLKSVFATVEWGGVTFKGIDILLVNGFAHYGQIVKVGNQYRKTEYTHVYPDRDLMRHIMEVTEPVSRKELIRLRHHFTRRIWMLDGVFECINWQVLNKEAEPHKPKLLPPEICYGCMLEGNKYIPKQLKSAGLGMCRSCFTVKQLYPTRVGWPIDLRHKGFGFTIIGRGINYTNNIKYYASNFDMSIYANYKG